MRKVYYHKIPWLVVFTVLAVIFCTLTGYSLAASGQPWQVSIIPASLNKEHTIRLVGGYSQPIIMQLQAQKEVTESNSQHEISISFDLPAEIRILSTDGFYLLKDSSCFTKNNRNHSEYQFVVHNRYMLGEPGSRLGSEWKSQNFILDIPEKIQNSQSYITTTLEWKGQSIIQRWPIKIEAFEESGTPPKLTRVALWSYNYHANDSSIAEKLAEFLAAAGVTHIQKEKNQDFHLAMAKYGITTGGNTHHGMFYSPDHPDYDITGKKKAGCFSSAQDILELKKNAEIPGVKELVENAKKYGGIATYDYEPSPLEGFSPASITAFKKKYQISDPDFEQLKQALTEHGRKTYLLEGSKIKRLYSHWVNFRTWQCSQYVRRISEAAKKQFPGIKIEVTPNDSFDDDSLATLSRGYNAAAMAPYTDAIMPQIYNGYGSAAAKLTMLRTRGWRKTLLQQTAKSKLYPILLVRYAGASVYNNPARLRQQIIGTLAEGANGFLLYYPTGMDGLYWCMLAETTRRICQFEQFYQQGDRVDELFSFDDMPQGHADVLQWPRHFEKVENPQWHFTAHEKDGRYLLTLFNLEDANDLLFRGNLPQGYKIISTQGIQQNDDDKSWLVKPQDIGFVTLEK